MTFLPVVLITVAFLFILENFVLGLLKLFGFYTIVREREVQVYVLFGDVLGVVDEPGLHFLWGKLGWGALIVRILGTVYHRSLALDQEYVRSTPVNSEEGAPMGIGVWYEMRISDPVAHIFRNSDPRGSLRANVSTAVVRCLSNLRLGEMLEDRHGMSKSVREEVSPQSEQWGYRVGSVYIRKVHFRDLGMTRQIEEKVVNRLRQVTSAIHQDGVNQVNVITSAAERAASNEFAKASTMRPKIVGAALQEIGKDPEVAGALFEILETQRLIAGEADITLLPPGVRGDLLTPLLAAQPESAKQTKKP